MAKKTPKYQVIKQYILDSIASGEYPVNHKIPTEKELAKQFDASRMTVNKAIRDMEQKGYLIRKPGLGSFVIEPKAESPLTGVSNISEEIINRGHKYHCEVLTVETITANEEIALHMGVKIDSQIYHTLIIHYQDESPIQVEERFVNPLLAPNYINNDFSTITPNAFLVKHCPLSDLEHTVEARFAPTDICNWLSIAKDSPCLLVTRRTWSNHQLVSYARLWHPGDIYKLRSTISL